MPPYASSVGMSDVIDVSKQQLDPLKLRIVFLSLDGGMISIQQILQKGITLSINIHFCNFFKFRTYFFPDYYLFNFTYYLSKTFPESRQTAPTFTKYSISVCYSSKYFSRDNFIEIDIYLCKFLFNYFIFTDKMFFF